MRLQSFRPRRAALEAAGLALAALVLAAAAPHDHAGHGAAPSTGPAATQPFFRGPAQAPAWVLMEKPVLRLVAELASEVPPEDAQAFAAAVDALHEELRQLRDEFTHTVETHYAPPDEQFGALAAARSPAAADHAAAMRQSQARYRGAEAAGVREWVDKHHTAARRYAALAAAALSARAAANDAAAAALRGKRFAARRPAEQAAARHQAVRQAGLAAGHRTLLKEAGYDDAGVAEYVKDLLATPAAEAGISLPELYEDAAGLRRTLAESLTAFAASGPAGAFGAAERLSGEAFVVANPREQEETVNLVVRRVSVPEGWQISLVEAPPDQAAAGAGAAATSERGRPRLYTDEAGRKYRVSLPAKGQIRVASEVKPGGAGASGGAGKWSVEGYIRGELIGGMMQEVMAPAEVPNLQLPPVGSGVDAPALAAVASTAGAPSPAPAAAPPGGAGGGLGWAVAGAAGAAVVFLLLFLLWRRRQRRAAP